jgi:hypothetical protein
MCRFGGDLRARVIILAATLLLVTILTIPMVRAQVEVRPAEFTAVDVLPSGTPYRLERRLVVVNKDNNPRIFILSVRAPLANELREGFDPIPNENWIILMPALLEVGENSWGEVEIWTKIPRWENLTDQRWQASISVKRELIEALGETAELEVIVVAKFITTEELPPLPPAIPLSTILLGVGVGTAAVIIGVWAWSRRKGRRSVGRKTFSRRWG